MAPRKLSPSLMPRATKKATRKKAPARKAAKSSRARKPAKKSRLKARTSSGGGSGFAFFFFICLCLATAAAVIIEVRNYIEYPCVQQFPSFRGDVTLTLYNRGAARRSAVVFIEQGSLLNKPRYLTRLHYLEEGGERGSKTERFEQLSWSSDAGAVFATRQSNLSQAAASVIPEILWLYDIDSGVFYRVNDSAIPGRGAEASQNVLQRYLYEEKGGPGKVIANWFDLGKKENYAFSWQTTRWNRAAKAAKEVATEEGISYGNF
ncbi:MAG: hypothetical protein ACI9R3_003329 [Verrucomicrobiales bacterium]|jgi:hypothetical protein